jgi:hypothetical protein
MHEDTQEAIFGCGVFIFVAITFVLFTFIPLNIQLGQGQHVGYITAVDSTTSFGQHGTKIYFKTDLISAQEDKYCIDNSQTDLINQTREAQTKKLNVVIDYRNYTMTGWGACDGDVINNITVNK